MNSFRSVLAWVGLVFCWLLVVMTAGASKRGVAETRSASAPATPAIIIGKPIVAKEKSVSVTALEESNIKIVSVAERAKWRKLRAIMACESGSRFVSVEVPGRGHDVGPCQINTYWHGDRAKTMGLDLWDPSDNIRYCLALYEEQGHMPMGRNPWDASRTCWETKLAEYALYDKERVESGAEISMR